MPIRDYSYDPSATYAARRHVTIHGVNYPAGAIVPRELAGDERTYRKWFEARMLGRVPATAESAASAPKPEPVIVPKAMQEFQASGEYQQPTPMAQTQVAPIANGNGHHHDIPASERLMEAVAASAAPIVLTPEQQNEGYIEPVGRGWCNVHFRGKVKKVRGLALASQQLDAFRAEVGLDPLQPAPDDAPGAEAAQATGALQPGDQMVDGETGEITTFTGGDTDETPDSEAPSAPWNPDSEPSDDAVRLPEDAGA
jgi:hypothetical protein